MVHSNNMRREVGNTHVKVAYWMEGRIQKGEGGGGERKKKEKQTQIRINTSEL